MERVEIEKLRMAFDQIDANGSGTISTKELDALLRRWMYVQRKHIDALAPDVVPVLQLWTTLPWETCPSYLIPLYEVADKSTRGSIDAFAEKWDDRIRCLGCFGPHTEMVDGEFRVANPPPCEGVNLDTIDQHGDNKGTFDVGQLRTVLLGSDRIVLKVNLAVYC